jgi:transcription termination factor NusB
VSERPSAGRGATTLPISATRRLAIDALVRIERDGAYANLVVPQLLARSGLDTRDRGFVTELVYGTTRMRRACDHIVDRFLLSTDVDPPVRAALRVGAYQLAFAGVAPHAAVDATVGAVPKKVRGLVNAVLRRVAANPVGDDAWPDDATRLSYPDWIVERLVADLGRADAMDALATMNVAPPVTVRADGYRQDPSSQAVAALVGGRQAAKPRRSRPRGRGSRRAICASGASGSSPPTARSSACRRTCRCSSPMRCTRRTARAASTGCWSTPPAPGSAPCVADRTPAGASRPTRSRASLGCRWTCCTPRSRCSPPAGCSCTPCAR